MLLLAVAVTALARCLTGVVSRAPFAMLDHPGARSLHQIPVSRVGGIALVIAAAAGVAGAVLIKVTTFDHTMLWALTAATGLTFTCSAIEDVYGLSPAIRFALQGLSAVMVVTAIALTGFQGVTGFPDWLLLSTTVVGIIWMANLFNFMDGSDGLAGGMSLFGFGALAAVAALAGAWFVFTTAALVAAATLGFLMLNLPPARVFMGDAGSVTLGFIAAALSSILVLQHGVSPYVPALSFAPFLLDATITLLRRLYRRERVWRPHRQHWYQRLVLAGWSHRQVLQLYWPLMVTGGAMAILLQSNRARESVTVVTSVFALHMLIPALVWFGERRVRNGRAIINGSR
jgi:UDP-GlcNAc:undecaprenyl-phosphate GlcNAc-1-phosphate transferase